MNGAFLLGYPGIHFGWIFRDHCALIEPYGTYMEAMEAKPFDSWPRCHPARALKKPPIRLLSAQWLEIRWPRGYRATVFGQGEKPCEATPILEYQKETQYEEISRCKHIRLHCFFKEGCLVLVHPTTLDVGVLAVVMTYAFIFGCLALQKYKSTGIVHLSWCRHTFFFFCFASLFIVYRNICN